MTAVLDLANLATQRPAFNEAQALDTIDLLQERLAELEFALEDEGWVRMTLEGEVEFSRDGLRKIIAIARLMFLKNPLIGRAVRVKTQYVWGQGVEVQVADEAINELIQEWMDDEHHQKVWFGAQARTAKWHTLHHDGNLFFVLFPNSITGNVKVRTIDVDEITEIVCNPEDRTDVWFYRRVWTATSFDIDRGTEVSESHEAWYPDRLHRPAFQRPTIGGKPVRWESPIFHVKVGGLDQQRFGLPTFYAAIDWAKAYKSFLEDWATIVRSLSRFAWKMTAKKGKVNSSADRLATTVRPATGGQETNPAPVAGSAFVHAEGTDLTPINKSGATVDADDAKALRLMVASGTDLPDTLLSGDPDQGTLATAKTLDRPTELTALSEQELAAYIDRTLINYQIDQWIIAPNGPIAGTVTRQPGTGRVKVELPDETDRTVTVSFPPILEVDPKAMLEAITMAAGTELVPDEVVLRLMLVALGVNDVDEIIDQLPEILAAQAERRNEAAQQAVDAFRQGKDPARAVDPEDPIATEDPDGDR
jgi:lipocalin